MDNGSSRLGPHLAPATHWSNPPPLVQWTQPTARATRPVTSESMHHPPPAPDPHALPVHPGVHSEPSAFTRFPCLGEILYREISTGNAGKTLASGPSNPSQRTALPPNTWRTPPRGRAKSRISREVKGLGEPCGLSTVSGLLAPFDSTAVENVPEVAWLSLILLLSEFLHVSAPRRTTATPLKMEYLVTTLCDLGGVPLP